MQLGVLCSAKRSCGPSADGGESEPSCLERQRQPRPRRDYNPKALQGHEGWLVSERLLSTS